ncbi:hypothetical protein [uncultured Kordia sp.]|uniref:hypothetical protein n=1 Tax=uncultured Kordia sp. TaxID=507699 RepID=UPI00262A4E3E|nr:hypothetical protein [uncultured Kordia sp.]
MKKKNLKNLVLNKKSISALETPQNIIGGNVNTVNICYKSKYIQGQNICYKTDKNCWHTKVSGCVPNTYQVNTDTEALC